MIEFGVLAPGELCVAELMQSRRFGKHFAGNIQSIKQIFDCTDGRVPQARAEERGKPDVRVIITNVGDTETPSGAPRESDEADVRS
jgi:hypothetical protein